MMSSSVCLLFLEKGLLVVIIFFNRYDRLHGWFRKVLWWWSNCVKKVKQLKVFVKKNSDVYIEKCLRGILWSCWVAFFYNKINFIQNKKKHALWIKILATYRHFDQHHQLLIYVYEWCWSFSEIPNKCLLNQK